MSATATLDLTLEDFSGQVRRRVRKVPTDALMGEFLESVVEQLDLPDTDAEGRGITYGARVQGSSVAESERIGEVLENEDVVTLMPNVTAG